MKGPTAGVADADGGVSVDNVRTGSRPAPSRWASGAAWPGAEKGNLQLVTDTARASH